MGFFGFILKQKHACGQAAGVFLHSLLYHTKNYQGTITKTLAPADKSLLYHTKNYQGTIT